MRLDKFLSQQLGISRALVARELRAKRVTVDGEVVKSRAIKLTPSKKWRSTAIRCSSRMARAISCSTNRGLRLLHRRSRSSDGAVFLDEPVAYKLHAAGRLDIDTTGLVLMTDDGQWSHRVTSPRHHCEKLSGDAGAPVGGRHRAAFRRRVQLHNEKDLTRPATLEQVDERVVRLTISEGRYHE